MYYWTNHFIHHHLSFYVPITHQSGGPLPDYDLTPASQNLERKTRNTIGFPRIIAIMNTPLSPPGPSFLGIPCELRLLIYDKVICLDIDFCIERASPTSTSGNQSLGERWDGACELPINRLALVCRSIANEIRSHARQLPSDQRVACIELRARSLFLYGIYQRRLPCRIRQVTTLDLEVKMSIPQASLSKEYRRRWVANKVLDLSTTLVHLLQPEVGILKDCTHIRDVRLYPVVTKPYSGVVDRAFDEFEQEIRTKLKRELDTFITSKLAERTPRLI